MPLLLRLRPWLGLLAVLIAALVPFGFAAAGASPTPQWRDDVALVRGADLMVSPGSGAVSTLLLQLALWLPIGPLPYRGALLAAAGLAAIGVLVYRLARRSLDAIDPSWLNGLVALIASLTATLSPLLQREGNVTGGASVAVALALGAALLLAPPGGDETRSPPWLPLGALLGLLALESPAAAAAALAVSLLQGAFVRPDGVSRGLALTLGGGLFAALVAALPFALRPLGPRALLGLAAGSGLAELRSLDVAHLQSRGLGAWVTDMGVSAFLLSCLGAAAGLARPGGRRAIAPALLLLAIDLALPARNSGVLTADPLAAVRALALCAAALAAAAGVQAASLALLRSRLALARPGSALIVAFHLTLAAISAEEGSARALRSANAGVEAWTDEALERLPHRSLVLVRSDAVAWRLWSGRLVSGKRPDVTVVPLPLLGHGRLAASLLVDEPALLPLLRDVSATGAPGEFALSQIADARPLFVELDPRWDRRLATHAMPERLWLRFSPQPLGPSDRRSAQAGEQTGFYVVAGASRRGDAHDEATLEVLAAHAREQAAAATLVGDKELAQRSLAQLASLEREPDDALWAVLDPTRKPDARPTTRRRAAR